MTVLELLVAAAIAILVVFGVQEFRVGERNNTIANLKSEIAAANLKAQADKDAIELDWRTKFDQQDKANHDSQQALEARVVSATAAADSVRGATARAVSAARHSCPAAVSSDQSGDDPIGVLAHVLGVSDDLAGVYAETAERRRGIAADCEARYDAIASQGTVIVKHGSP